MNAGLVKRLGDTYLIPEDGPVGMLDLLARVGLPVPEGFVLTRDSHRDFLWFSRLYEAFQTPADESEGSGGNYERSALPRSGEPWLSGEELTALVRSAVLDLDARTVSVSWEGGHRGGLGSLSEVLRAIRRAWLPQRDFQTPEALSVEEELTAWPVLVQREPRPEYTGWSTTEDLSAAQAPAGRSSYSALPGQNLAWNSQKVRDTRRGGITLYDVKPAGQVRSGRQNQKQGQNQIHHEGSRQSIASLTSQAGYAVGSPVSLEWGLESGRWYVLSASRPAPENNRQS